MSVLKQKEIFISQRFIAVSDCAIEGHNMVYWHERFVGTSRFHLQGKDSYVFPSEFTP
jgi:hypothetical protein